MKTGKFVFSHILDFIPKYEFQKCIDRYKGEYRVRSFSCYDQFLSMAFAQLTGRESLRDIEICLRSLKSKLYHVGFRGKISKSTLADANEKRDNNIYADLAKLLMIKAQDLYVNETLEVELNNSLYALDSTTIDLCLSMFSWAKYKKHKGAIKLHTVLNLRGNIPSFISISNGKGSEFLLMDQMNWQSDAFYLMDRGYIDFSRLYKITNSGAFFVIRMKDKNIRWKRVYSNKSNKEQGILCDQIVSAQYRESKKNYPTHIRRIKYYDTELQKKLIFFTNNFDLHATTIAKLYKQRWQVELFFKWIKQHLRIKSFYGTSENAVRTQIWIAISVYLVIAIIKKTLKLEQSLYTLSQIFSLSLFERTHNLKDFINQNYTFNNDDDSRQLNLLDP